MSTSRILFLCSRLACPRCVALTLQPPNHMAARQMRRGHCMILWLWWTSNFTSRHHCWSHFHNHDQHLRAKCKVRAVKGLNAQSITKYCIFENKPNIVKADFFAFEMMLYPKIFKILAQIDPLICAAPALNMYLIFNVPRYLSPGGGCCQCALGLSATPTLHP